MFDVMSFLRCCFVMLDSSCPSKRLWNVALDFISQPALMSTTMLSIDNGYSTECGDVVMLSDTLILKWPVKYGNMFYHLLPGFLSLRKEEPLPELSPRTPVSGYSWPRRTQVADKVVSPSCFRSSLPFSWCPLCHSFCPSGTCIAE